MTVPVADSLGMTVPYGAIFDRPETGSPAATAGIEAGDVITAINGTPLTNWRDLATIAAFSPGTVIYLSTSRNGEPMEINLTLGSGSCARKRGGRSIGTPTLVAPDQGSRQMT
jgi:serine protease Do